MYKKVSLILVIMNDQKVKNEINPSTITIITMSQITSQHSCHHSDSAG